MQGLLQSREKILELRKILCHCTMRFIDGTPVIFLSDGL
jgi:hypothetical protein